jgi:hypothetical protein
MEKVFKQGDFIVPLLTTGFNGEDFSTLEKAKVRYFPTGTYDKYFNAEIVKGYVLYKDQRLYKKSAILCLRKDDFCLYEEGEQHYEIY